MQQFSAPFWPAALSAHASEVDLILLGLVVLSTLLRPATNAARMPLLPIRWTQAHGRERKRDRRGQPRNALGDPEPVAHVARDHAEQQDSRRPNREDCVELVHAGASLRRLLGRARGARPDCRAASPIAVAPISTAAADAPSTGAG